MRLRILALAALPETLGRPDEAVYLPACVATRSQLRDHPAARGGDWAALTTMKNLKAAIHQGMAGPEAPLAEGDEVAFFPPVTGG